MEKEEDRILTSICSAQHPNTGPSMHQIYVNIIVCKIFDIIKSKLEFNPSICTDSFDVLLHYPTQVTCKRDRFYAKYSFWPSNLQPIYHHHSDKTWHEIDPIFETRYLVYTVCNNKQILFCIVKPSFGHFFWTDLIVEHLCILIPESLFNVERHNFLS